MAIRAGERCLTSGLLTSILLFLLSGCEPSAPPFTCTDTIGCIEIAPGSPIKLGGLMALSGFEAPQGIDGSRAAELAFDDWDNKILGHPIALQAEDTECSGGGGMTAALKLVADPEVVAILAVSCSVASVPAAKIMSEAGLSMVSGDNTLPSLTAVAGEAGGDWQPGYFRRAISARSITTSTRDVPRRRSHSKNWACARWRPSMLMIPTRRALPGCSLRCSPSWVVTSCSPRRSTRATRTWRPC